MDTQEYPLGIPRSAFRVCENGCGIPQSFRVPRLVYLFFHHLVAQLGSPIFIDGAFVVHHSGAAEAPILGDADVAELPDGNA